MTARIVIAAFLLSVAATAQTDRLWREGGAQMRELSGGIPGAGPVTLQIVTQIGDVHLHADTELRYALIWRGADTAATTRFERWPVEITSDGATVTISAQTPSGEALPATTLELNIGVPPQVREIATTTTLGPIFADGLSTPMILTSSAGNIHGANLGPVTVSSRTGDVLFGDTGALSIQTAGRVEVEHSAALTLVNHGGSVRVRAADGPVRITSDGGAISIGNVSGALTVDSAGGNITVNAALFSARLQTGGGSIVVASGANLVCDTSNGDIQLRQVSGRIQAHTGAGQIAATFAPNARLQASELISRLGGIALSLPASMPVNLLATINTPAGHQVRSDWPGLVVSPRLLDGRIQAQVRLSGGGPTLQLTSTASDITLTRQ